MEASIIKNRIQTINLMKQSVGMEPEVGLLLGDSNSKYSKVIISWPKVALSFLMSFSLNSFDISKIFIPYLLFSIIQ